MATYYVQPEPERFNPWVLRLLLLGITGFMLLIFAMMTALAGYQFMVQDQIYPGIAPIYGVDISGMTQQEAMHALSQQFSYGEDAKFVFQYGDQQWEFTATELGVTFDVQATVDAAYAVGRSGNWAANLVNQWEIYQDGYPVAPVIEYDQTQAQNQLNTIAESFINRPLVDATLTLTGGQVQTTQSQSGLRVDVPATLSLLQQEIIALNTYSTIQLIVEESQPAVVSAEEAAAELRTALDQRGVTFYIPAEQGANAGPWTAQPASIENMLRIERLDNGDGTASYDVSVTLDQAREFLVGLGDDLNQQPKNARFIFNDETRQLEAIESSVNGRRINVEATLANFPNAVFSDSERTVPIIFEEVVPTVNNNATAAELGIIEQIGEATTYYVGSSAARRANIQVAASRYHGLVIPPGGEFSYNEWLGDVSVESGFEQGLIIVGNQTITGVGGGVCQVTSTFFQAAFYAGFPILERYPHAYRVGYYETGEGPGMDATVYSPIVDFRFLNDTPHHLLIETYMYPATSSITVKFYSTSMGRRVVKEGPIIRNQQPAPAPIYRANPNLAPGSIQQVDYAVAGAEVFVYRTVYEGDRVIIDNEEFYSRYIPWSAQYEVAPGDPRING